MTYSYVTKDFQSTTISITDPESLETIAVGMIRMLKYPNNSGDLSRQTEQMAMLAFAKIASEDSESLAPLKGLFQQADQTAEFNKHMVLKAQLVGSSIQEGLNNPNSIKEAVSRNPKSQTPAYTIIQRHSCTDIDSHGGSDFPIKVTAALRGLDIRSGSGYEIGYNHAGTIVPIAQVFISASHDSDFKETMLNTLHYLNQLEDLGPEQAMKRLLGKAAGKNDASPK